MTRHTPLHTPPHTPLPRREAWAGVARCFARTWVMLARGQVHLPTEHVGQVITFADGTRARVYRETRADRPVADPCVLVVAFTLRVVRGRGHALFRLESILNTPLFVGFPGFGSKLWLAHDQHGTYRGIYEWDRPEAAERYARSLWRVLGLVCRPGSIDYRVLRGLRRDAVLADPGRLARYDGGQAAWWRVVRAA